MFSSRDIVIVVFEGRKSGCASNATIPAALRMDAQSEY